MGKSPKEPGSVGVILGGPSLSGNSPQWEHFSGEQSSGAPSSGRTFFPPLPFPLIVDSGTLSESGSVPSSFQDRIRYPYSHPH